MFLGIDMFWANFGPKHIYACEYKVYFFILPKRFYNDTFCFFRLEREIAKAEKENQAHQKEVKFFALLVGASFSFDFLKEANHRHLPGELEQ